MRCGPQPWVHAATHLSTDSEAAVTRRVLASLDDHCDEALAGVERAPQRRASGSCTRVGLVPEPLLGHVVRLEQAAITLPLLDLLCPETVGGGVSVDP
jgi:hypothetical protein